MPKSSELLLFNGTIWPATGAEPVSALLIRQGRVAGLGEKAWLEARAPRARRLDLEGRFVMPGLIDAHCHPGWYADACARQVDLRGVRSWEVLAARLRERVLETARPEQAWVLGHGFDQELLPDRRMPTAADLDAISTEVPLVIQRFCCHALVASSLAMARAGVHASRGWFTEDDMGPVLAAVPPPDLEERVLLLERACRDAAAAGLTGLHGIVLDTAELEAWRELAARGPLPVHVRLMGRELSWLDPPGVPLRPPCRTLKIFVDGSLGARTAALSAPYADDPTTSGRLVLSGEALRQPVMAAHLAGYPVAIHAIGDVAVAEALEAFAEAQSQAPRAGVRHRLEHVSVLPPAELARLRQLGVVACVQPQFVESDFWTAERLGPERAGYAYPIKTMLMAGIPLAGGTDAPVEAWRPFQALARAIRREPASQRLSFEQAVRLFSVDAAYAFGEEGERGTLLPGYWADLLVLREDPRQLSPEALEEVRPELTLVEGRVGHASRSLLEP